MGWGEPGLGEINRYTSREDNIDSKRGEFLELFQRGLVKIIPGD